MEEHNMCPPQSHEQRNGEERLVTKRKDARIGLKEQQSFSRFCGLAEQLFLGFSLDPVVQHKSASRCTKAGKSQLTLPTLAATGHLRTLQVAPHPLEGGTGSLAWQSQGGVPREPRQELRGPLGPRIQICPALLFPKCIFIVIKFMQHRGYHFNHF